MIGNNHCKLDITSTLKNRYWNLPKSINCPYLLTYLHYLYSLKYEYAS